MISESFSRYLDENSDQIIEASITQSSREVATDIAGYIAKKLRKRSKCLSCKEALISESVNDSGYLEIRSRGGLNVPSQGLADLTCNSFAALDHTSNVIQAESGKRIDSCSRRTCPVEILSSRKPHVQ